MPTLVFLAAFIVSWAGVGLFQRWSLRRRIIDVPNERSSHSTPTPRGGGIVIVMVTLAGYVLSSFVTDLPLSYGYLTGAIIISLISWLDDLVSLPFWSRLAVHVVGAGLLVADSGYWSSVFVPTVDITVWLGSILGVIVTMGWLVWLINAYNFMDGIDGIAGTQALVAGVAWAILGEWFGLNGTFLFAGILASAALGFLVHNWTPASIFMGDVGSAFLGFTLGAIPILANSESPIAEQLFPAVGILFVWYFVFDTLFTFFRRLFGGQRVWEAHREHIYQRMVISGWRHSSVTLVYGLYAAILSASVLLAIIFSGKFATLALLFLIIPTVTLVYFGIRKND